ncbi:MAG: glycosyltransferase [Proteobacteria bacterium]|nr:glycosyltransferase [Pseudomonadota bacterium]
MSLVTLTDHDTIAGGLTLIDRPDFFLSEEVTTTFPDGAQVHVLTWNITAAQHDRIQAARSDVYALVELLRRERIVHACAHPLVSPNHRLSVATLEQCLVLFPILEGVNGLSDRALADDLHALVASLDERSLAGIAARHPVVLDAHVGRHVLVAGSDDHGLRHGASCSTAVDRGRLSPSDFLAAIEVGEARCCGRQADLNVIHLTASRVAYGFLSARTAERADYRDPFVDLIDVIGGRERGAEPPTGMRGEFVRSLLAGAARAHSNLGPAVDPLATDGVDDASDARAMDAIRRVHDGLVGHALDELVDGLGDLDMYRLMGGVRDLAGSAASVAPFLFAARHFGKQRQQAREVLARWSASSVPRASPRLAVFSDSLEQLDGVAMSIRRMVRSAISEGRDVRIPYCGPRPPCSASDAAAYLPLESTSTCATAIYEGMSFYVPSILGTIDWLWRNDITHVELATPGPMGIVGLAAARLLNLPTSASYHTELPELSRLLTENSMVHGVASQVVRWFYGAVDRVFAMSSASRDRLLELGISAKAIEIVSVAIDPDDFSPSYASTSIYPSLGVVDRGPILLSVSRLSREKNLPLMIEALDLLGDLPVRPVLVIVGDGPERATLEASCARRPWVVFVGAQQGETLRRLYASASAFVFASTIDTLGLVTMEAMASGISVLVPEGSAITEVVHHGRTGYRYAPNAASLAATLREVLHSPMRETVARNARDAMVARWDAVRAQGVTGS